MRAITNQMALTERTGNANGDGDGEAFREHGGEMGM